MAILAMKCLRERPGPVDQLVSGINTRQIAYVKGKQGKDGGFDDLVSTAMAVQVLQQNNIFPCSAILQRHVLCRLPVRLGR